MRRPSAPFATPPVFKRREPESNFVYVAAVVSLFAVLLGLAVMLIGAVS